MKQSIKLFFCICFLTLFPLQAMASDFVPYKTETLSADKKVIETQTAFKPLGQFIPEEEIESPEDIFHASNGNIYIADSGTKRIVVADENGNVISTIGEGVLESPTGVYVDEHEEIYVADYGKQKVFLFSPSGKVEAQYGKPDSPLFGKSSSFKPQKVGVDRRGNIYIISEGSTNGIIQLSKNGSFLGYYGVNATGQSFSSFLQRVLTSNGRKSGLFMKIPPAPTNIAMDEQGLIYSITEGTKNETIKKLNVAGKNMLAPDITDDASLQDLTVDENGNMLALSSSGKIYEFDSFGHLLFIFGGKDDGLNRLGLFKEPTGIAVDHYGRIYVTDKERGIIQVFESTTFSQEVHKGIALYKEGLYVQSQKYWQNVLKLNSSFGLAHTAMGKAYYKQQAYGAALKEFKFAQDVQGYSDSFWEVRHAWMQNHLEVVLLILIICLVLYYLIKAFDKKYKFLETPRKKWALIKERKLISELLFLFKFFKHPIDSFYYLKRKQYASVLSATILYVVLTVEYLLSQFKTGFIFNTQDPDGINLWAEILMLYAPILLFIIINYLVSTINDGEGRFKDIYIGTIYSFAPYLVFSIFITIISNVLTLNESFIYIFSTRIVYAWCLLILFIMIKEIHNYSFSETVRNVLVTLFGMVIMVLVIFIIFVLGDQVYKFVYSIMKEVILRV